MKKIFTRIILIFLVLLTSVSGFTQETTFQKSDVFVIENGAKFYVHTVKAGETLYSLSKNYGVTVEEIAASNINSLTNLSIGQQLKIPYVERTTIVKLTDHDGVQSYVHYVKLGETLYGIAKQYKVTPFEIKQHNKGLADVITVGQKIYIPTTTKSAQNIKPETEPVKSVKSTAKVVQNGKTYLIHKVNKGETVYSLSKLYATPQEVIYKENPELRVGLKVGQSLRFPTDVIEFKETQNIFHTVSKGETLFSISKKYSTTVQDIVNLNPGIDSGLKSGSIIKVPINGNNRTQAEESVTEAFFFHEVQKGDTYYSLSQKYSFENRAFKKLNKGVDIENLAIGTILKIPGKNNPQKVYQYIAVDTIKNFESKTLQFLTDTNRAICCDSLESQLNRPLNIILFLPFYLSANDTIELSQNILKREERIYNRSLNFIEFYEGVLLAINDLKKLNISINLTVYDTEKDTNHIKSELHKLNPKQVDLIIGPVYERSIEIVTAWAAKYSIPVVSPLSAKSNCIDKYPNLIIVNTPEEFRLEATSLYLSQYQDYNFVFLYNAHVSEYDFIQDFKKIIRESDSVRFKNTVFKEINYPEMGINTVETSLSKDRKNLLIIPSNDQAFVNDIITKLYQFVKDYEISIYGLAYWEQYQNIELDYLFDLNLTFATSNYIDYTEPKVKNFTSIYRKTFKTDPSLYSFRGYDIMYYFTTALKNYGSYMPSCIASKEYKGLQTDFKFERLAPGAGLTNKGVFLISYTKDYKRELIQFDLEKARQQYSIRSSQNAARQKNEAMKNWK